MSSQKNFLDNHPGVLLVVVGDNWRRLVVKCVLKVAGQEEKDMCGTYQLCGGVDDSIDEGIHVMSLLWQQSSQ